MEWIIALFVFLLGLAIGSFLNVVINRLQTGESWMRGRSKCMECQVQLTTIDLIPVASFLFLKGKCRSCKTTISKQYPLVELATGLLFLIAYLTHQPLSTFVFISFLIIISVYDLKHMLILDKVTVPAMMVAFLLNLWLGIPWWSMLIGAILLGGFFFLQHTLSRGKWVGGGDIRLGALMGLMLGWQPSLVALFFSYVIGALVGVGMLIKYKNVRGKMIPFGPFLVIGTIIALFAGQQILDWYLGLILL